MTQADDVLNDLRRNFEGFTLSQKRIAELVVEDPEFVAFATVDKFAARLGVSPSTIVRFAYRLRLNGYPDLQSRVREYVRGQMRVGSVPNEDERSVTGHLGDGVLASSIEHDLTNVHRTVARLSLEDLEHAVSLLVSAHRIFVTGGFASGCLAQYAGLALGRMRGHTSVLAGDMHTAYNLLDLTPEDAVLAFSFPPYASHVLQVVSMAREQGASVVAITDTPIAPIAQHVDAVLAANVSGIGAQNSLIAPMVVANALLNAVANKTTAVAERYGRFFHMMDDWSAFVLRSDDA